MIHLGERAFLQVRITDEFFISNLNTDLLLCIDKGFTGILNEFDVAVR